MVVHIFDYSSTAVVRLTILHRLSVMRLNSRRTRVILQFYWNKLSSEIRLVEDSPQMILVGRGMNASDNLLNTSSWPRRRDVRLASSVFLPGDRNLGRVPRETVRN